MTKTYPPPPIERWASAGPAILRLVILAATAAETLVFAYICARLWFADGNLKLMVPAGFAVVAMTLPAMLMASKGWWLRTAAALAMMSATANWHLWIRLP